MFCWAFSIRDLESNESLIWCEDIRHSTIFVRLHLYVWVRVALIAICEHEKLCVGEVKRNNSMHVIHPNNQPMQWIMTHCKHLGTLGKIVKNGSAVARGKSRTRSAREGKGKRSIAPKDIIWGMGSQTVKKKKRKKKRKTAFSKVWWGKCQPSLNA